MLIDLKDLMNAELKVEKTPEVNAAAIILSGLIAIAERLERLENPDADLEEEIHRLSSRVSALHVSLKAACELLETIEAFFLDSHQPLKYVVMDAREDVNKSVGDHVSETIKNIREVL